MTCTPQHPATLTPPVSTQLRVTKHWSPLQQLVQRQDQQQQQQHVVADAPLPAPPVAANGSSTQAAAADAAAAGAVAVAVRARMGAGPLSVSELCGLAISMSDFEAALPKVQPSVRREGFTTKPDATWADVGSLEEVRGEL